MNAEDEKINVWGARVHNLKNVDVEIPPQLTDSHYRTFWFGKVIACLRHHLCRGTAPLHRDLLCLCPQLPGQHGTS